MQTNTTQITFAKLVSLIISCLLVSACQFFDGDDGDTETHGRAVKGVISNAIIKAYATSNRKLLAETRTNNNGDFSLDLSETENDSLVLIELTVDQDTRMRCDLIDGCLEQKTGQTLAFGNEVQLPAYFTLLGVTTKTDTKRQAPAFLSPLSHIVIKTAQALPNGLTQQNLDTATRWVIDSFDLEHNPITVSSADLTHLDSTPGLDEAELQQAILGAVLYSQSIDSTWSSETLTLSSIEMPGVFKAATELAAQLSTHLESLPDNSSNYASALNQISDNAQTKADELESAILTIQTQPKSITVDEAEVISLYVQASGAGTLNYQWQKDGVNIPGATQNTFTKSNATMEDSGIYAVVVSNQDEERISFDALVEVNERLIPVSITEQPKTLIITEGETATLSVTATGDGPLSYQWQKGGSILPNANAQQLTLTNSQIQDSGSYRVRVSNSHSFALSSFVNLTVSEKILPPSISEQPESQTLNEGGSLQLSVTASGGGFLSYQWRKDGQNINNAYNRTFEINELSAEDAGAYDVKVSNSQGESLSLSANISILPLLIPVSITQQPRSADVYQGENVTLSVRTLGDGPLSYQWFLNDRPLQGATDRNLNLYNLSDEQTGIYTVEVSNESSTAFSQEALVSIKPLPSLQLSWLTPAARLDGSALSSAEIEAYYIEYGNSLDNMNQTIMADGGNNTEHTLQNLLPGTYYLRIATLDIYGTIGTYSAAISITLD